MSPAPSARIRNKRYNTITGMIICITDKIRPQAPDSHIRKRKPVPIPRQISRLLILPDVMSVVTAMISSNSVHAVFTTPIHHLSFALWIFCILDYKSCFLPCLPLFSIFFIFVNFLQKLIQNNSVKQRKPADTKGSDCQKANWI